MRKKIFDNRKSLWDLGIFEWKVGNKIYTLEKEPERGGSCIVYSAFWKETFNKKEYKHHVLLKEFYPLLNIDENIDIVRNEDGSLRISEELKTSEQYANARKRFLESYSIMLKLQEQDEMIETISTPLAYIEANGTWYIEEAYDTGITLYKMRTKNLDFERFLIIYKKCMIALKKLHQLNYYHLDLKPENISLTNNENIKLFDTDSFIKKEDLKKLNKNSTFLVTKGFSAPEIRNSLKNPEDAFYLIGPWTDVYSMTQVLCWYLYGYPLERNEIDEAMKDLQERIKSKLFSFGWNIVISRLGLYRLELLIRRNLSVRLKDRIQSMDEMLDELNIINQCLFNTDFRKLKDNFIESREHIIDYQEKLAQLEETFFGESQYSLDVAILTGFNQIEREKVARYFITLHRMNFGNVVEIHCNNFSKMKEYLGERDLKIQKVYNNYNQLPNLFVIFDEQEKDFIKTEEIAEISELISAKEEQILIVGKYDRCCNRKEDFSNDICFQHIEVGQQLQKFSLSSIRKNDLKDFCTGILGIIFIIAGAYFVKYASNMVNPYNYFDTGLNIPFYSIQVPQQNGIWIHILGSCCESIGIIMWLHCIYNLLSPYGWRYFIKEFHWPIMTIFASIFSMTLPSYFAYIERIFDTSIEIMQFEMKFSINITMLILLISWILEIFNGKKQYRRILNLIAVIALVLSIFYLYIQTKSNLHELILFFIYWFTIYMIKNLLYEKIKK